MNDNFESKQEGEASVLKGCVMIVLYSILKTDTLLPKYNFL